MLTLNDMSLEFSWHLNTNHRDFWKVNVQFKGMKAEEMFCLSFLAICFVSIWVNLKVQTVFLYQSLWHVVQGKASIKRRAVCNPTEGPHGSAGPR